MWEQFDTTRRLKKKIPWHFAVVVVVVVAKVRVT